MRYFKLLPVFATILLFVKCSTSPKELTSVEAFSSYMNDNKEVIAFGKASLKQILEKSDYKKIETAGGFIDGLVKDASKAIDVNGQVYYSVSMQPNKETEFNVSDLDVFIPIKNKGEFKNYLEVMGFEIQEDKKGGITAFDENVSIITQEKMAILHLFENETNPEETIKKIWEKCLGKESSGKIAEIIHSEGDAILALNTENIVKNTTKDSQLSDSQQEKLNEYAKEGFTKTIFHFNEGKATVNFDNSFNDNLMSAMPLRQDESASIVSKLGSGKPRMGFSINMDLSKMNDLLSEVGTKNLDIILNDILPDLERVFGFQFPISSNNLNLKPTKLMNGELGVVLFGKPDKNGRFTPEYNTHFGLNDNGGLLSNLISSALGAMSDGTPTDGISYSSSPQFNTGKALSLPKGAENFGKSGLSFFIDLEGIDTSFFEKISDSQELITLLKVSKFIAFEYSNNGGSLQIQAKNGQENILKQLVHKMVEDKINQEMNLSF